ncbi:MAG: PilZ domain-containing protein [candidate division FCPU426 bacterium]
MAVQTDRGDVEVENRKYPRHRFKLRLRMAPLKSGELPKPVKSLALDVGAGGMAIHSRNEYVPDQLLTVILYLPQFQYAHPPAEQPREYCETECLPITILCRVVWCRRVGETQYKIGLAFIDIERQRRKLLKHFLVEYEMDEEIPV